MTISTALQLANSKLTAISDAPQLDAERLLGHVLGHTESAWLYAHEEELLTSDQEAKFELLLDRRATGEPLAYILGEWEFYGRPFFVTPDVLVPRPATEALIDAALSYVRGKLSAVSGPFTIADIGTGSGIIAITLALELSTHYQLPTTNYKIFATDISPAALAVARRNAKRHGVTDHIEFIEGDMLAAIAGRQIDLIVSNPPYVPSQELDVPHFAPASRGEIETRGLDFEPRLALDGGPDGQKFIEHIKNAGIPALVEGTNGDIRSFNLNEEA